MPFALVKLVVGGDLNVVNFDVMRDEDGKAVQTSFVNGQRVRILEDGSHYFAHVVETGARSTCNNRLTDIQNGGSSDPILGRTRQASIPPRDRSSTPCPTPSIAKQRQKNAQARPRVNPSPSIAPTNSAIDDMDQRELLRTVLKYVMSLDNELKSVKSDLAAVKASMDTLVGKTTAIEAFTDQLAGEEAYSKEEFKQMAVVVKENNEMAATICAGVSNMIEIMPRKLECPYTYLTEAQVTAIDDSSPSAEIFASQLDGQLFTEEERTILFHQRKNQDKLNWLVDIIARRRAFSTGRAAASLRSTVKKRLNQDCRRLRDALGLPPPLSERDQKKQVQLERKERSRRAAAYGEPIFKRRPPVTEYESEEEGEPGREEEVEYEGEGGRGGEEEGELYGQWGEDDLDRAIDLLMDSDHDE